MSIKIVKINALPEHITQSEHFKLFKALRHNNTSDDELLHEDFGYNTDFYIDNIEVDTFEKIQRIILSDNYFMFDQTTRIKIFKNIEIFKAENDVIKWCVNNNFIDTIFSREIEKFILTNKKNIILCCMKYNFVDLLEFAIMEGYPQFSMSDYTDIYFAAEYGNVECLQIGLQYNFPITSRAISVAVLNSHIDCFDILLEHGCPVDSKVLFSATENSNFNIIQHVVNALKIKSIIVPWNCDISNNAAIMGHYKHLRYALDDGCPYSRETSVYSAISGNIECLKIMDNYGLINNLQISYNVAKYGHIDAMLYLIENKKTIRSDAAFIARIHGHILLSEKIDAALCKNHMIRNFS